MRLPIHPLCLPAMAIDIDVVACLVVVLIGGHQNGRPDWQPGLSELGFWVVLTSGSYYALKPRVQGLEKRSAV
jgi:hypothetical protein